MVSSSRKKTARNARRKKVASTAIEIMEVGEDAVPSVKKETSSPKVAPKKPKKAPAKTKPAGKKAPEPDVEESYEPESYEEEAYEELNSRLPNIGDRVTTNDGLQGEVSAVSVLKQMVKVIVTLEDDEKESRDYKVSDLQFKPRRKKEHMAMDAELRELERLEKKEGRKSSG